MPQKQWKLFCSKQPILEQVGLSYLQELIVLKNTPNIVIFVSPELSSGRDLVIQMSVRRAPCAVRRPLSVVFCPEHISGTVYDLS